MTKTDAAVQTLSEINPDVVLEVGLFPIISIPEDMIGRHKCHVRYQFPKKGINAMFL